MQTFIIGRNPNVSAGEIPVKINDLTNKVSSNHCRITFDGVHYFIEDLISTNGTFVNGKKINSKTMVFKDSVITLGEKSQFHLNDLDSFIWRETYKPIETENISRSENQPVVQENITIKNVFLNFIDPYLGVIDKGSFFKTPIYWFYIILGGFFLLLPFVILIAAIKYSDYLNGKMIFGLVVLFLIFLFAGWIVFQILWNRKDNLTIKEYSNSIFAIPIVAHLVKTLGEVLGTFVAIVGFGLALIISLFFNDNSYFLGNEIPIKGFSGVIAFPIIGFLIVLLTSYLSETIKVLAEIAINTSKKKN